MQQIKQLPIALEQNQQPLNTLVKYMEPISISETLKEKILPFTKLLIQLLRTIKKLNGVLKDIYLSYLED